MLPWLAASLGPIVAHAYDDPNRAVTVHVAVVHALGAEHPWGARVGADWQLALGDHCTVNETECRGGVVWPVAGPAGAVTWRGGDRFTLEAIGELGVAGLDMAQFGFAPMWEVIGRVGLRVDVADPSIGLGLGGFAAKSFGLTVHTAPGTTTIRGTHFLGLRVDADAAWMSTGAWTAPTMGAGIWLAPMGTWDFF